MASSKSKFTTITEYINTFPKEVRGPLQTLRQAIQEAAPEATETISYHMPTFQLEGVGFVCFAAWKKHIGLYGTTQAALNAFEQEVSAYTTDKGTLQFPLDQPLPLPLIRKLIKFRVKETKRDLKNRQV